MDQSVSLDFSLTRILRVIIMIMIVVSYFGLCLRAFHLDSINVKKEVTHFDNVMTQISVQKKAGSIKVRCQFETKRVLDENLRFCRRGSSSSLFICTIKKEVYTSRTI